MRLNQRQKLITRRVLRFAKSDDFAGCDYIRKTLWVTGKSRTRGWKRYGWVNIVYHKGGVTTDKWIVNCHLPVRYAIGKHKARIRRA